MALVADEGLKADEAFGMEPITIGDVTKELDVCEVADKLYDAQKAATPDESPMLKASFTDGAAANAVFSSYGFPALPLFAAVKFANQIGARALELGKEAGNVWDTSVEPALPPDFLDSTLADSLPPI